MKQFGRFISLLLCLWQLTLSVDAANSSTLCSVPPESYAAAIDKYPDSAFALKELQKHAIAVWYSDNKAKDDNAGLVTRLLGNCPTESLLTIVVYGLPNKDCEHNYSNNGKNKSPEDYSSFVQSLADAVDSRRVLYILEPDALGLAVNGGCADDNGYVDNLQKAIEILSTTNTNAEIYLDVGFWTLTKSDSTSKLAKLVKTLAGSSKSKVKGITLNTSNYRSNDELVKLCATFQTAMGSNKLKCIIDSSRNYNGASKKDEWCNAKTGGIGLPPTSSTGLDNVDYLVWIKPPGDSDGECDAKDRTKDAMKGPAAGEFFQKHFQKLWNHGYFVKEQSMATIGKDDDESSGGSSVSTTTVIIVLVVVAVVGAALIGGGVWLRNRSMR